MRRNKSRTILRRAAVRGVAKLNWRLQSGKIQLPFILQFLTFKFKIPYASLGPFYS